MSNYVRSTCNDVIIRWPMRAALATGMLLLSACMPTRIVRLDPPISTGTSQVTILDRRTPHDDRSYLSGGGNIYSCLYGIMRVKETETVPERLEYLRAAINAGALAGRFHAVTVTRFDAYVNSQAEFKQMASGFAPPAQSAVAGAIQGAVREAVSHNGAVIGCEGTATGEYWSDEYGEFGHPVLVYLEGEADGIAFNIRQLTLANTKNIFEPEHWSAHVRRGIDTAISSLVAQLGAAAKP